MAELWECAICLGTLHSQVLVGLYEEGRRACRHFLHERCAQSLLRAGFEQCPWCRATFEEVWALPALRSDPQGWFRAVDLEGDGSLGRKEILDALVAALPLDQAMLGSFVTEHWLSWDASGEGRLKESEFLDARYGLLAHVLVRFGELLCGGDVPNLKREAAAWFFHFAELRGHLEREEIVRGVRRSLQEQHDLDAPALRDIIAGSAAQAGIESEEVSLQDFLRDGGLKDSLVAALARWRLLLALPTRRAKLCIAFDETTVRVVSGVEVAHVTVGAEKGCDCFAQNPPELGDTWEVDFESEGGAYEIWFNGGTNPYRGILTVSIDGVELGTIDQYSSETTYPSEHMLPWRGGQPGTHTLRGSVQGKDEQSEEYCICLSEMRFVPIPREAARGSLAE